MISQEEVCIWFKNLEGYSRIELMCTLLDSCLPLELRFLGTYLEYSAGKHYTHLQKWERDANKSSLWLNGDEDKFSDKQFRRKFCIFLALLHSHNRSIAVKLFEVLNQWEDISESTDNKDGTIPEEENWDVTSEKNCRNKEFADKISFYNEMRLLFSMASLHPALDFAQRANLRTKKEKFTTDCKKPLKPVERIINGEDLSNKENHLVLNISEQNEKVEGKHESSLESAQLHSINVTTTAASLPPNSSTCDSKSTLVIPVADPEFLSQAPLVSRTPALPVTVQNIPHLPMDNVYQMPPYRTSPMLLPRSQIAGVGMHRPLEQQIPIHVNIPLQPVQCVVNNQQFIQNNISVHTNSMPTSTMGNIFLSQDSGENTQTLHKNNPVPTAMPMISSNAYTPRTLDNLNNFNFLQMGSRKPFSGQYTRYSKLVNGPVGNDDSSLPSHVYSVSVLRDTSTLVSTVASIPTHTINRRCLSESDAQDNMNSNSQEHLQNIINPKSIPITYTPQVISVDQKADSNSQKYQYFRPLVTQYGSNPVYLSKFHTTNHTYQNLPNNNVNRTENSVPNHVIFTYNTQRQTQQQQQQQLQQQLQQQQNQTLQTQQQQQQLQQQNQTLQTQQLQPSSPSRIITNSALIPTLIQPQPMLPISTIENSPAIIMNQQQPILSPMKTFPSGLNGTYIPGHAFDLKGIRQQNVLTELQKYDLNVNQAEHNENVPVTKSLPIPVQPPKRQFSSGGNYPPDIIESSCSSPSHSPKPSPHCSPAQSPISRRKETHDIYSSTANWLKSIRLHKYSEMLEDYPFEKLKEMDEEDFKRIGLTVGASNKIKQQIDLLTSRGLKEFGNPENATNPDLPVGGSSSSVSPASVSPVGTKYLSTGTPPPLSQQSSEIQLSPSQSSNLDYDEAEKEEIIQIREPTRRSSVQQIIESNLDDLHDEFLHPRKQSEEATCYNCGHVGHYGDECTEQTMESMTYIRYSFQLDYSRSTQDTTKSDVSTNSSIISTTKTTATSDTINR